MISTGQATMAEQPESGCGQSCGYPFPLPSPLPGCKHNQYCRVCKRSFSFPNKSHCPLVKLTNTLPLMCSTRDDDISLTISCTLRTNTNFFPRPLADPCPCLSQGRAPSSSSQPKANTQGSLTRAQAGTGDIPGGCSACTGSVPCPAALLVPALGAFPWTGLAGGHWSLRQPAWVHHLPVKQGSASSYLWLAQISRRNIHFLIRDTLPNLSSLDFTAGKNELPELLTVLLWGLTYFISHFSLQFPVILIPLT